MDFAAFALPMILVIVLATIVEEQKQMVDHFNYILLIILCGYALMFIIIPSVLTLLTVVILKYRTSIFLSSSSGSLLPVDPKGFVENHKIFSILTPIYATAFVVLFVAHNVIFGTATIELEGPFVFSISQEEPNEQIILKIMTSIAFIVAYTSFFRFIVIKYGSYPYSLSRAYFIMSRQARDVTESMLLFIRGLHAYNNYLKRNFKFRINDLQRSYAKLISGSAGIRNETMEKVRESFLRELQDTSREDKLYPLRQIKKYMDFDYKTDFLVGTDLLSAIQDWIPLIGIVIPLLVGLVEIMASMD